MTSRRLDLAASILAAERAARWSAHASQTLADDPFRLDLPMLPTASTEQIDAATMELLGGLYLIALLEQTGMLRAAELLAEQRMSLDVRSLEAVELLENVAGQQRSWYREEERAQLYARVFGIGPAARSAAAPNTGFESTLLDLTSAIVEWGDAQWFRHPIAPHRNSTVTSAARALRTNLAPRQHGNTRSAAQRLAGQVTLSHQLLSHAGIIALTAGRSMWDVVRALWGGEPPDIDRLVTLGQAGQQVIGWAGSSEADRGEPSTTAIDAATLWLASARHDEAAA